MSVTSPLPDRLQFLLASPWRVADPESADTLSQVHAESSGSVDPNGACDRALTKPEAESDADQARVQSAWPFLIEPIKAAILALVGSASPSLR